MVDEVQDFSPLELAVLLDATTRAALGDAGGRHRAGDRARTRLLDLDRAARLPRHRARARRAAARQLPVDARDRRLRRTRARPADRRRPPGRAARGRARRVVPVRGRRASAPSSCRTRSRSWCATSPTRRWRCSRATPSRRALYYEALAHAEVPSLRLVADQDFSFSAGIDVTDVRQSKGLEFDIVILLEVTDASYPGDRRRAPPAARGDDPRRAPALDHLRRHPLAAAARSSLRWISALPRLVARSSRSPRLPSLLALAPRSRPRRRRPPLRAVSGAALRPSAARRAWAFSGASAAVSKLNCSRRAGKST